MTFKPRIWFPIAAILTVVNVAAAWFAASESEPWHAAGHAALAVVFALWAQRLARGLRSPQESGDLPAQVEELRTELLAMREQLLEANERMDFAERLLAQEKREARGEG